jgi:molecular chaperone HscB
MSTASTNYFELFDLPIAFEIDQSLLASRYLALQRAVHPDRYASAPDHERRHAMQTAATLNDAFRTLKHPLSLHDVHLDDEKDTVMDPAFLMEQMELREELAEIRAADDPLAVLQSLSGRIGELSAELAGQVAAQFAAADHEGARDTVRRMQFLARLAEEAEALEADLEDEFN